MGLHRTKNVSLVNASYSTQCYLQRVLREGGLSLGAKGRSCEGGRRVLRAEGGGGNAWKGEVIFPREKDKGASRREEFGSSGRLPSEIRPPQQEVWPKEERAITTGGLKRREYVYL